ncbi:MAG: hypothetical protein OQK12_11305 [Motiliproteus sp.]|nr:hypothetical protein [Motiliproteus sp.]MCW9052551.1 hypothetical protein [Motiliproteus sp.]
MESVSQQNGMKWQQLAWIIALLVLLGYLGWLGRTLMESQDQSVELLPGEAPCDIRNAPCTAARAQQQILFAIDSPTLDSSTPVDLRVELQGFDSDKVEVELQGRDMFMGENTYKLKPQPDGSFRATGYLPVCTTDLMVWRATVRIKEGQKTLGGVFDFEAR